MACAQEMLTGLWTSAYGGVSSNTMPPGSQNRSEMTSGIYGPSPRPEALNAPGPYAATTSSQISVVAPEASGSAGPQFSTEPLQPKPPISTLDCAPYPYHRLDAPPILQKSYPLVMAEAPSSSRAPKTSASTSPSLVVSMSNSDYTPDLRPNLVWAPSQNPAVLEAHPHHESINLSAGVVRSNLSQSASVTRPENSHNRVTTNRHQRFTTPHPYTIPLVPSNYVDSSANRDHAERMEGARNLAWTDPNWRLTLQTYEWLFAVMYPKRRPDKKKPTPSGPCLLCDSTCKRPGILQQHLTILHRQRLARKHLAGQPYKLQLALAFVVAQVLCGATLNAEMDDVLQEIQDFLAALKNSPAGLGTPQPQAFPLLRGKLDELSRRESWVGVQCQDCGMWATRPIVLEEHSAICAGINRSGHSMMAGSSAGVNERLKLTASGLAARPTRDAALDT
jgi:hypothetical protein